MTFCPCLTAALTSGTAFHASAKNKTHWRAFFREERANDGTAEGSRTVGKKKAFKRKHQDFYLRHRFFATGDTQTPCLICGEAMKPSKLHHTDARQALKDKTWRTKTVIEGPPLPKKTCLH